ncbi:MAG: ribulose-phosphate 3-epimerase [Alistipes sp.]|nr:ribulose-phosphate 3-epimerase [Alistipes sp.]MBR2109849.1 ribulose-phosphate 3-epimerase [Alistipes sp.]MBR3891948.1 ribulose-phosphate 3-epimerase [Alistipes sp.]MBR6631313.1 ribulose-phosphate 3-epimerase [Alistipes sp.]
MKRIIAPSVLSADFGNLNQDIAMLDRSRAEWVHIDVMDGVFVPNISFGFPVMKPIRKATTKVLDVHLMITAPEKYVERFVEAGADYVTFHYEATENIDLCIDLIRKAGAKVGISIKPGTEPEVLDKWLDKLDLILVMSVEPGFGGQKFMPSSIAKCEYLSRKKEELGLSELIIEVDGGISASNSRLLFDAGAEALVAGSSVFGAESPEQAIVDMLNS